MTLCSSSTSGLPVCACRGVRVEAIHPFGVFVEVLPGQSGLVHVSELDTERTADPAEKVQLVHLRFAEVPVIHRLELDGLSAGYTLLCKLGHSLVRKFVA